MTFPAQLLSIYTGRQNSVAFSTSGVYYYTVPSGVTLMSAACIGGGGGGSGSSGNAANGTGGGGGGGLTWGTFSVIPGDTLRIVVGGGGDAGIAGGGAGGNGGSSSVGLSTRSGVTINELILNALGGTGGQQATTTGIGGAGGTGNIANISSANFKVYLQGGGTGGSGGSATAGAAGGGGSGGYTGNGGNGGTTSPLVSPTAAALNSGGGGGGGGNISTTGLGYGGGGAGSYGYVGTGQGDAGTNNTGAGGTGGGGASFYYDPGSQIAASFVGHTTSTTSSISYPSQILPGDFLLLLSGSDADSGITKLPVPIGFTTFASSDTGQYYNTSGQTTLEIIPDNQTTLAFKTKDLNFSSSYRYVPAEGLSGTLVGLATTAIHDMIALRSIPKPAQITWAADSGDPAINPGLGATITPMPDPPTVLDIPNGAVGIAVGFLSNTLIEPSPTVAGSNTIGIATVNGGEPPSGTAIMSSYLQAAGIGTYNPNRFLTGTASHAIAFSIEVERASAGTAVSLVGSAVTSTYVDGNGVTVGPTTLNLPSGIADGDLVIYIGSSDSRKLNDTTGGPPVTSPSGFTMNNWIFGRSNDDKGGGNLAYRLEWKGYTTGDSTTLTNLVAGSTSAAAAHMVIVLRGAFTNYTGSNSPSYVFWDNGSLETNPSEFPTYGPPNPPEITTVAANSMVLAVGILDNVTISNVSTISPPNGYIPLASGSYGVQNNGAIIMSAYKTGLTTALSENPSAFTGAGANIWASQTIIIGGAGNELKGTNIFPGQNGGGGASRSDETSGEGMPGAQGAVRLIWGTSRFYPSTNQNELTSGTNL